jgi:putative chitinase
MIAVTLEQIAGLAPGANAIYRQAFADADALLAPYGINDNPLRLAHFMAQGLHETGGLKILTESMNYSPEGLVATFGETRISSQLTQQLGRTAAHPADQRAIANTVYGGDFGRRQLGNTQPDDGWNFRGHGFLQMTGRDSFQRIGALLGVDLAGNPDLAIASPTILLTACEEWKEKGGNALADADNIQRLTKAINGGQIGLAERRAWLVKTKAVWQ